MIVHIRLSSNFRLEQKKDDHHEEYREKLLGALSKSKPGAIEDAIKEFEQSVEVEKVTREDTSLMTIARDQKTRLEKKESIF